MGWQEFGIGLEKVVGPGQDGGEDGYDGGGRRERVEGGHNGRDRGRKMAERRRIVIGLR